MSGSVETLKELYGAWNRRDVDAGLALLHPDVELLTSGDFPGMSPVYTGRDQARKFYEDLAGLWERLDLSPHEYRALDDGSVPLTLYRFVGHGRGGGRPRVNAASRDCGSMGS